MSVVLIRFVVMYLDGVELMIIIMATFGQTLCGEGHAVNCIATIIVWRGLVSCSMPGLFAFMVLKHAIQLARYRNRW